MALAASQGIPGRFVNLYNYPKNDGHTLAEVFIDNKWHLYDPTFDTTYNSIEKSGEPLLSFAETLERYKTRPNSIKIKTNNYRPDFESYTGKNIFLNAFPLGIIGPDHPMIFPLVLTLGQQDKIEKKDLGPEFQGADYIGAAAVNHQQQWQLKGLSSGKIYEFIIQPDFLDGDNTVDNKKFIVSIGIDGGSLKGELKHTFDFESIKPDPLRVRFIAEKPQVTINITHPYLGPDYHYIIVESYQLKETQEMKGVA